MSLLPEGYKRLLYIESTGTQWIDTEFVPTATAKVVAEVQYANVATAQYSGLYSGSYMMFGVASSKWEVYLGNKALATTTTATAKRTTVVLDAVNKCAVYDGVSTAAAYTSFGTASLTMPIFVLREGANSFRNYSSMKLFSYKVYNGTALVRNFIPCINDAGEVGLYETVNGVFCGNSGAGVFVAGPEFWYDELEYIESTGTQYINTGFIPDQDTRVVMDIDTTNAQGQSFPSLFSTDSSGSYKQRFTTMIYMEKAGFHDHYGATAINSSNIGVYGRLQVDKNKNVTYLNGNAVSNFAYTTFKGTVPLILLASLDQGVYQYQIKAKLYSCEVYDNGTLLFDFAPIKLYDGTVGLLDKVSGLFYGNAGTGTFVAGPVVEEENPPRKVTVDLIPPMTGEKTDDFTIEYSVVDDAGTDAFEVVEYIDGVEQRSLSVAANEKVSTIVESTGMVDGLHTFMIIVDGTVEVEYSFHVNNTTTKVEATELSINMPTTVTVNEKFLISVIITELSFTIAKLKIHAGDVYSGEV